MLYQAHRDRRVGSALAAAAFVFTCGLAATAQAQDRLPPIPRDKLNPAQKEAISAYEGTRDELRGPWWPMMRAPQSVKLLMPWSEYLRHGSSLSPKIYEMVILVTAREWSQAFSFDSHRPRALSAGLKPETAKAIAEGRRPREMAADEEAAYDLSIELHRNHSVSDATYARALSIFGEQGIIDIIGVNGHYTLMSMVLNTARTPAPADAKGLIERFPN
jgi:4-carboxymuconolactone decarboxylase